MANQNEIKITGDYSAFLIMMTFTFYNFFLCIFVFILFIDCLNLWWKVATLSFSLCHSCKHYKDILPRI